VWLFPASKNSLHGVIGSVVGGPPGPDSIG